MKAQHKCSGKFPWLTHKLANKYQPLPVRRCFWGRGASKVLMHSTTPATIHGENMRKLQGCRNGQNSQRTKSVQLSCCRVSRSLDSGAGRMSQPAECDRRTCSAMTPAMPEESSGQVMLHGNNGGTCRCLLPFLFKQF